MSEYPENPLMLFQSAVQEIKSIISAGRSSAYNATSTAMLLTYWSIGRRIVEEEQTGNERAEYGTQLISILSEELTQEFGKGFTARNLRNFRKFYLLFPEQEIWHACVPNLNWTHFRSLLRIDDEDARIWYMKEASEEGWSKVVPVERTAL